MFRQENGVKFNIQLLSVCRLGEMIYSKSQESLENIFSFLANDRILKKEEVLNRFLYALACDYFFTVTKHPAFSDMATSAYAEAVIAFQNNPSEFLALQRFYKSIKEQTSNVYKKKLHGFLSRLSASGSLENRPTNEECIQAIQELAQNINYLDGLAYEYATILVNEATKALNESPSIESFPFVKLYVPAFDLYSVLCTAEDYANALLLMERFSTLTLAQRNEKTISDKTPENPPENLWLIHELLIADNIPKFILMLTHNIQMSRNERRTTRRSSVTNNETDADNAMDLMNGIEAANTFNRRLVRAKRHVINTDETNDMAFEILIDDDKLDEDVLNQKSKKRRKN